MGRLKVLLVATSPALYLQQGPNAGSCQVTVLVQLSLPPCLSVSKTAMTEKASICCVSVTWALGDVTFNLPNPLFFLLSLSL